FPYTTLFRSSLRVSDDAALLRDAASEPARFAALYRLYVDDLYRYLLSRCGDAADAEDLVAETFLAAFRSARGYRGSGPVKAWLVGIARRKAADARRDRRPHVGLDEARELVDPIRTRASVSIALDRALVRAENPPPSWVRTARRPRLALAAAGVVAVVALVASLVSASAPASASDLLIRAERAATGATSAFDGYRG